MTEAKKTEHRRPISSDLTFITNEYGRSLAERFNVLLATNTRFFDCLVGYFFLSGFRRLVDALVPTEKIRILIGLETDRPVFNLLSQAKQEMQLELRSHAEAKELLPSEVLAELEEAEESSDLEAGVRTFVEWAKSGKLEVRVFPSAKLHAKLYIMTFFDGLMDMGRVVTGSSNFSQSGLVDNLEFNVELKNRADYEFALVKFNELWAHAVEVTDKYVQTIELRSPFAQFTPYELFLKFLYEYFKAELSNVENADSAYLPSRFMKLKYQDDAVTAARRILEEYGGVFLADVVGLGKTYMAALLAQQLTGRNLVLAPPTLLDDNNPGSWPNVFRDFQVRQTRFQSVGKLEELIRQGVDNYENVFIDESHRFRTETNQTYERLAQICRGKRVILVSATPLNNRPQDILSQVKLFQNGKASTIPNIRDLESFFGRLEKQLKGLDRQENREEYFATVRSNAKEIREKVLKYLMIRRTRTEIARYYAVDLNAQNLRFPEVSPPEPLYYQLNTNENRVFTRTIERLTRDFTYARYSPLAYYQGERSEVDVTAQKNLARFMKILLVKRLESSFRAFRLSLDRFIYTYERFLAALGEGYVYISKKQIGKVFELLEQDDLEAVQKLIDAEAVERLPASSFTTDFRNDLEKDLSTLRDIRSDWETIDRDPKWDKLAESLRTEQILREQRIIIFTESKETAVYITNRLRSELNEKVLHFTGDSDASVRQVLIQNFDARAAQPSEEYRILVSTEVLAEGVSLHRANVVLNYDIPWNPTRLIQRVGRVNRVDTPHRNIYTFHFFPTEQSNGSVQLDHGLLGFSYKLLSNRFVHIGVPRRGAPLSTPGCCAPDNFLGRIRDVRGRINESRILSAKFQKNRSQVLCSRLHDDLAHLDAAGEKDEVKRQFEELRNFFFAPGDGSDRPGIEIFRNKVEQKLACGGQTLREFEDAWIACRNHLDCRIEEQRQWPIERADYQGYAVGLSIDLGSMPAFAKCPWNDYIYGLHPFFQFGFRESRGTYRSHDLENFFLTGGLEIAAHRSLQSLGVLVAQVLETCQLVNAPLVRLGRVRIEVCFLFVKDFLE
jgi:SNF2 family DNA or RNA helicase